MREKIAGTIGSNYLGMTLVEKRKSPPGRASIDGLPQPVEYKNRLIE
jgi:hypothetical protein